MPLTANNQAVPCDQADAHEALAAFIMRPDFPGILSTNPREQHASPQTFTSITKPKIGALVGGYVVADNTQDIYLGTDDLLICIAVILRNSRQTIVVHITSDTSVEALLGLMENYSDGQGYTIRLMGGLGDQPFTLAEDKSENFLSRYSRTVLCCGGNTEENDPPPSLLPSGDETSKATLRNICHTIVQFSQHHPTMQLTVLSADVMNNTHPFRAKKPKSAGDNTLGIMLKVNTNALVYFNSTNSFDTSFVDSGCILSGAFKHEKIYLRTLISCGVPLNVLLPSYRTHNLDLDIFSSEAWYRGLVHIVLISLNQKKITASFDDETEAMRNIIHQWVMNHLLVSDNPQERLTFAAHAVLQFHANRVYHRDVEHKPPYLTNEIDRLTSRLEQDQDLNNAILQQAMSDIAMFVASKTRLDRTEIERLVQMYWKDRDELLAHLAQFKSRRIGAQNDSSLMSTPGNRILFLMTCPDLESLKTALQRPIGPMDKVALPASSLLASSADTIDSNSSLVPAANSAAAAAAVVGTFSTSTIHPTPPPGLASPAAFAVVATLASAPDPIDDSADSDLATSTRSTSTQPEPPSLLAAAIPATTSASSVSSNPDTPTAYQSHSPSNPSSPSMQP